MKVLVPPKKNGNIICTIAIGKKYYDQWYKYSYPSWKIYCKKFKIGLIVFNKNLIDKKHAKWKKPTWQKLLIAKEIETLFPHAKNLCYLDTDILINYLSSPNIFDFQKINKISLVSQINNLPYDLLKTQKKIAFYRNIFYSKRYPLDSALFMTKNQIYDFHNLKRQKDYACMGLIMFNIKKFKDIFYKYFFLYDKKTKSLTGGDEPIMNFILQHNHSIEWLDYKFQSLWIYEIANNYPFLYEYKNKNNKIIKKCVQNSLFNNYFLHFAGSWYESKMIKNIFNNNDILLLKNYFNYENIKPKAIPKGIIKP